jgi:hypothetical protein
LHDNQRRSQSDPKYRPIILGISNFHERLIAPRVALLDVTGKERAISSPIATQLIQTIVAWMLHDDGLALWRQRADCVVVIVALDRSDAPK